MARSPFHPYRPVLLGDPLWFPDPDHAPTSGPANGLVAIGGDLSGPRLLLAYRSGIFPWTSDPITWWSPHPRAILEVGELHIPRSLARTLRQNRFRITIDRAFPEVIQACAAPAAGRDSTWISTPFIEAYTALHDAGHAHSLECWEDDRLVGGIYGVAIGGFFAGESMFHRAADASKVALVKLVQYLGERGFLLFDVQMPTPITARMGVTEIARREYLERLRAAVAAPCRFD